MNPMLVPLLNQAIAHLEAENLGDAESILKRVIQIDPKNFNALHILGVVKGRQNNPEEAIKAFKSAVAIKSNDAALQFNLAKALMDNGQYDESIPHHKKVAQLIPNNPDVWMNYGGSLKELQQYDYALKCYEKVIQLVPSDADAWSNKGVILNELKRYDEALAAYEKAISLDPGYPKSFYNLGITYDDLNRLDEALASYDKAISLKPDYFEAYSNRGITLNELKRYEEALASYDKAISLKPDYFEAYSNRGITLNELKRYEEALASYDKAISLKPDYFEAYSNRGATLNALTRYQEASASYDKAINLKPDYFDAYWNKALNQLVTEDFEAGWKNYEYRWKRVKAQPMRHQQFSPLTNLNDILGKRVLVWSEQGYGDTIQFSRFIKKLIDLKAEVIFEVQDPLKELCQNSFTQAKVIGQNEPVENIDFQVPLASLPGLFSTNLNNIPNAEPYLEVSETNSIIWQNKLNLTKDKLNIGIACSGNKEHSNDKNRSMDLSFLEPITTQVNLFLIQKDLGERDRHFLNQHPEIQFLGDKITSFNDSASIIQAMDLIISVDTSLAHLSGALGKPTLIALPWNPEWRWLLNRKDSPWYASARLFRQPKLDDWGAVIKEIALYLKLNT